MAKVGICAALLLCLAGLFLVTSCAQAPGVLRVETTNIGEAGYFPVDVADWHFNKTDSTWYYTVKDPVLKLTAYYFQPGNGFPTWPSTQELHLDGYKVAWQGGASARIPTTTGALDEMVEADETGKLKKDFSLLLIPGANLDSVTALADLRADPSNNEYFNGQIVVPAKITFTGHDLVTNELVTTDVLINVAFEDYVDPNNLP